jgi:hypothetical protein
MITSFLQQICPRELEKRKADVTILTPRQSKQEFIYFYFIRPTKQIHLQHTQQYSLSLFPRACALLRRFQGD